MLSYFPERDNFSHVKLAFCIIQYIKQGRTLQAHQARLAQCKQMSEAVDCSITFVETERKCISIVT